METTLRNVRASMALSFMAALSLSCEGTESFTGPLTSESCGSGGRTYSDSVPSGTWSRAASPHVLIDSVVVAGALVIERGALVCGMPGSTLTATGLEAIGTDDSPIVFTSDDPDGWGGLRGEGVIRNARIERTGTALLGSFEVEHSVIHRSRGAAVVPTFAAQITLRDVLIDSACTAGGCAAVGVGPFGGVTLEDVAIRWSGGSGISAGFEYCGVTIDGGSIEGSAGVGIQLTLLKPGRSCVFNLIDPVRITGGGTYPARVHANAAVQFLRDAETQAALTGNALDTLIVNGDYQLTDADLTLTKDLPVRIGLGCGGNVLGLKAQLGMITMEPGASLALANCEYDVHLRANGTADDPVTIRGASVARLHTIPGQADTAYLRHVVFRDQTTLRADSAPVIIENITMYDSSLELFAAGSRIDGLEAIWSNGDRPLWPAPDPRPTLVLHSGTTLRNARIEQSLVDGIVVDGDDVSIDGCTITTSAQHGIHVLAGAPVIRACNISANTGDGIHNAGTVEVDAVHNWWGDALGPLGPDGDGVFGNVLFDPFLGAPVAAGAGRQHSSR